MENETAKHFLSIGLQSWGQSDAERKEATDDYLKAAGFDLAGDRKNAEAWLKGVIQKMPWGKFEREADHLAAVLDARKAG
jgi:hypothetical protein